MAAVVKQWTLLLALILGLSASPLSAQTYGMTDIDDLVLIYVGNRDRTEWTADKLLPYVVHTYADGSQSWMFDGFLMIDFLTYNSAGQRVSLGEYNGPAATKDDWISYLDAQFGLDNRQSCVALDSLVGVYREVLGNPTRKHKVVFSLPIPIAGFDAWGEIDGRKLDFNRLDDRLDATKWYVDRLLEKWHDAGFEHLELEGVYWVKESFDQPAIELSRAAHDHFKSLGLKVYWVPYSAAKARGAWRDNGIDVAYIQPNYSVWKNATIDQLNSVIDFAKSNDMGLEIELDGYSFYRDMRGDTLVRTIPGDCGLYGVSPAIHQRVTDYIDRFEQEGVFDAKPVAYYTGYQGIYDFDRSDNPRDRALLDRLASIINRRHVRSGWIRKK